VNLRRLISFIYFAILGGLALIAAMLFSEAYEELKQLKQTEAVTRAKLAAVEQQLADQKRILERLKSDPAYVEKVIREKLRYAKPGEMIFKFREAETPERRDALREGTAGRSP
jgi:cell division protein DivIC